MKHFIKFTLYVIALSIGAAIGLYISLVGVLVLFS